MEKPLVIGKAAKPRCFRKLDIRKLPVEWGSNKNAWMTSQIMEEWLTAFNGRRKCKTGMFHYSWIMQHATPISNFPTCDLLGSLQTPLVFLNQWIKGIVRNVKVHYHKLLMQSLLANTDCTSSGSELARTV